jgi:hypothetical protein
MSIDGMEKKQMRCVTSFIYSIHSWSSCNMQHHHHHQRCHIRKMRVGNNHRHREVRTDDTVWYESDQYNTKRIAFIIRRDAILSLVNNCCPNSVGQFEVVVFNGMHMGTGPSQTDLYHWHFHSHSRSHFVLHLKKSHSEWAVISSTQRDINLQRVAPAPLDGYVKDPFEILLSPSHPTGVYGIDQKIISCNSLRPVRVFVSPFHFPLVRTYVRTPVSLEHTYIHTYVRWVILCMKPTDPPSFVVDETDNC